jgi:membrane protein DedA with SNARE-associated domain
VLLVAPIIALVVAGTIGNAVSPALIKRHPLLLIALDARNRFLLATAVRLPVGPFMAVGLARRLASDPLFFALGFLYGDQAVRWVEKRFAADTGIVPWIERNFGRLAPVLVFLFPGALVCTLAGALGMSPVLFAVLNVAGTLAALFVLYRFADAVRGPVLAVTDFIDRHFLLFTAITVLFTLVWLWDQRRRDRLELPSLAEAEAALGGETAADDGPEQPT